MNDKQQIEELNDIIILKKSVLKEELQDLEKQARKETAREIYQELQGHGTTYVKKWIKEHYAVEVNNEKEKNNSL